MKVIENKKIDEKVYIEKLENEMTIEVIPKHNTQKKYIIWGTKFGSNDNHFIEPNTGKEIKVPDGVAHYLEHKMFEQESGVDSLYTLMALGLDANAYTTNDHTAYLFGGIDNFYAGLDELMDYVQHPYFTDENVTKERGIIGQEIQMYDNEPEWKLYLNAMRCLYKNNPITLDVAGSKESISHITKEILYSCYNTFYHPSNTIMVISGDFEPEEIIEEVKKRLLKKEKMGKIERIYPSYENDINQKKIVETMNINMPLYMIGYRDFMRDESAVKKDVTLKLIFDSLLGKCSNKYQELYEKGLIMEEMDDDYEFSDIYAHEIISGESKNVDEVYEEVTNTLENGIITEDVLARSKRRLYGEIVSRFDDVEQIGRVFLQNEIKGINPFEYIDILDEIDLAYANKIQKEMLKKDKAILSTVK